MHPQTLDARHHPTQVVRHPFRSVIRQLGFECIQVVAAIIDLPFNFSDPKF